MSNKDYVEETEAALSKSERTSKKPESPKTKTKKISLSAGDIVMICFFVFLIVVAGINLIMHFRNKAKEINLREREKIIQEKSLDLSKRDKHVDERRPDADQDIIRRTKNIDNRERIADTDRKNVLQLCDKYGKEKEKLTYFPRGTNKTVDIVYKISNKNSGSNTLQTIVSMTSACENAKFDSTYLIHVLHLGKLKKTIRKKIKSVENKYLNQCFIDFIDVEEKFNDYSEEIKNDRAYYTFALPSLLSDVAKTIFLDADTYILKDLQDLYNTEFKENKLIAGHWVKNLKEDDFKAFYNIKTPSNFINTGVSVWNLQLMREKNVEEKLFTELKKYNNVDNVLFKDMGIINIVLEKEIMLLPPKYGMLAFKDYGDAMQKNPGYNENEYLEAFAGPSVIHYSSIQYEPWRNGKIRPYGIFFYQYLKKTDYFEEYIDDYLKEYENQKKDNEDGSDL